jgi:cardiolipin synthase
MAEEGDRRARLEARRQSVTDAVTGRAHGVRKLLGIDRSGPDPTETRQGQPLRPFTLPNFIGYLRLLSIPLFLVLAFDSGDGRSTPAVLLYLWITLGDLLDGFLARVTGQYSRMGALLDPIVDRLSALAGAAVCWHFHLLPRWAIVALAARELATLFLAEFALRRNVDIEVAWIGRIATLLVFGGIFWSMVFDWWLTQAVFVAGVAVGIAATYVYVKAGVLRRGSTST